MTAKRGDVIDIVREAESRSAERIESARRRAEEMKSSALREAAAIREEAERKAREAYLAIIEGRRVKIEEIRRATLTKGEEEAMAIRALGTSNLPRAVDVLLSRLGSEE